MTSNLFKQNLTQRN